AALRFFLGTPHHGSRRARGHQQRLAAGLGRGQPGSDPDGAHPPSHDGAAAAMTPDAPAAIGPVLPYLDLAGIAVFALSGAVVAAEKRQTLVTFVFFAVLTGVGGGTVRDLLIGAPVFWMGKNV